MTPSGTVEEIRPVVRPRSTQATIAYHSGSDNPKSPIAGVSTVEDCTEHTVTVTDIRPKFASFSLDQNGFQVVSHVSALRCPPFIYPPWSDLDIINNVYNPEIMELAKEVTGAKKTMILLASARNAPFEEAETAPPYPMSSPTKEADDERTLSDSAISPLPTTRIKGFTEEEREGPVRKAHKDWGIQGARNTLRNWSQELLAEAADIIVAEDEAASLPGGIAKNSKARRWALYTTWRPLKNVKRDPMGYVDYFTSEPQDGVSFWRTPSGIHGKFESDVLLTKANPKHKWYWISDQTPNEVLFMKIFDTKNERHPENVAGGVHHCSFHLPGTENEETRESIETKFIAFW